ncbi:LysR family transcriptional regulator [Angustibacter aerolatus]
MDLTLLRAFVRVSDTGSVSAAAALLGYSQPGISQQIHTLERRLGCRLFQRGDGGLQLTHQGAVALPYAKVLLGVADTLVDEVRRS